ETEWLAAFLAARTVIMKKEAAHSDLSRIIAQQKFISENNWQMMLPMQWEMYGDRFELRRKE
ncbi:MAG: chitosanase, partial [Bacteroidales bacterium]|nr:chitosanase [Bacteroidales bacterium]